MRYAATLALIAGLLAGTQAARAENLTVGRLLLDCDFSLGGAKAVKGEPPVKAKKATLTRIARHLVCIA